MNSKRVNGFFLTTIVLHVLLVALVVVFRYMLKIPFEIGIVPNLIVSSALIAVPTFLFLLISGEGKWRQFLGFYRIRISTALAVILITFLLMPFTTLLNAISMLFVRNAMNSISMEVLELPFAVTFFFMAISGPFFEELAFRGLALQGYRRSGNVVQAIVLSALLFGMVHMNFNQGIYAFALGIVMAVLVEATGSIWSSLICHITFNGWSVLMLYLSKYWSDAEELAAQMMETPQQLRENLYFTIGIYVVISVVTLPIAGCLIYWIAGNEGRRSQLAFHIRERKKERGKVISIAWIVGTIISLAYMVMDAMLFS